MRTNMKISKKINIGLKSNHTSMKTNKKLDFMSDEELNLNLCNYPVLTDNCKVKSQEAVQLLA